MSEQPEKTYRPWEPERYRHEAQSPAAKLPAGDLVFFLLDTVPQLNLRRFYVPYETEMRGAPPFDPAMMVCLLLYAYCVGVFSSRKIAWPCTCPLRINIAGSPVDRHRGKKAWTRGLAWHPRGPCIPGNALTAGRVGVHRLCRPPPRAASHHSWVLTLPPAAARGAHETTTLRVT